MQFLKQLVSWGAAQPPLVRWATTFGLIGVALLSRWAFGRLYGAIPALTFYPTLLLVSVMFGWKEAGVILCLSALAGLFLFLTPDLYLQPIGWLLVGSLSIAIINALKNLTQQLAAANERQTVLFQEMQHRVANTLQSLIGTLDMAARRVDTAPAEAKRLLGQASQRIAASAGVHRRLHDQPCFTAACKWSSTMPSRPLSTAISTSSSTLRQSTCRLTR